MCEGIYIRPVGVLANKGRVFAHDLTPAITPVKARLSDREVIEV